MKCEGQPQNNAEAEQPTTEAPQKTFGEMIAVNRGADQESPAEKMREAAREQIDLLNEAMDIISKRTVDKKSKDSDMDDYLTLQAGYDANKEFYTKGLNGEALSHEEDFQVRQRASKASEVAKRIVAGK
jgi:hypothetical protein